MSAVARGDRVAALAILGLALTAAVALKLHYSAASADDLRWILAPTAGLVELATGAGFVAEAGTGYLSTELRYLIAPSCAGVNFLIVAFCALVLGFVRPYRRAGHNALVCAASAAAAFAAALVANTIRIALAIWLHVHAVSWGWLTPDRVHRIAGVVVYLGLLLVLFAAARGLAARRSGRAPAGVWLPVGAYLGVALLVPLANGGHARADFWEHAAVVVAVLVGAGLVIAALRRVRTQRLLGTPPAAVQQRLAALEEIARPVNIFPTPVIARSQPIDSTRIQQPSATLAMPTLASSAPASQRNRLTEIASGTEMTSEKSIMPRTVPAPNTTR